MNFIEQILAAKTIWLSTHKNSDGDGLGSEVAFYYALKSLGKNVRIIHNDETPKRYHFLTADIEIFSSHNIKNLQFNLDDLCVIFDTHDPLLCAPLFDLFQENNLRILFVDHHVPVKQNLKNVEYLIDETATCTGEIVFELIQKMNVKIDHKIATPLYASLIFDTQNFRFIRGSARPFQMATNLLNAGANHLLIQQNLFDNWTAQKMNYLSNLIQHAEYKDRNKIVVIKIDRKSLHENNLESDDVSDFIDLFMSIQSLEVAIVIREEDLNHYKLSFRSRNFEVLSWAQSFNGGGHLYSSGAWVKDSLKNIDQRIEVLIGSRM